jgi:hypothetical protein
MLLLYMNTEPTQQQEQKKKKRGFFQKNKEKIAKATIITINILFIIGISISVIANAISPITSIISAPSLITLFFQFVAKYQPSTIEKTKELLLRQMDETDDKTEIDKVYSDIASQHELITARSMPPQVTVNNAPYDETETPKSARTERLPCRVLYNEKSGKYEIEVYDK